MSDQFTPSQKEAIEYRGKPVIVSAGAGSGKTRVLTERLMKYIVDDNVDIDKFVVITFTQAAAAELKTRISKALREKGMKRQEALLERAHIGTIHHFCGSILRENAHAVHINPDFRIVSDERASEMKANAIDKLMDQRYKDIKHNPDFEELVNSVGKGRTDDGLVELVLQLHAKMQCHPDPKEWAIRIIDGFNVESVDAGSTIWGKEILDESITTAVYWSKQLDKIMLEMAGDAVISKAYMETISITADGFREYIRALRQGWDKAVNAPEIMFQRPKSYRNAENVKLAEKVKDIRGKSKSAAEKLRKNICEPSEVLLSEMNSTAKSMEALLQLVLDFDDAYSKEKRRLNYLDYNDLEHMASEFLSNHDISDRYAEIMVDEYQDVSRVQDDIFHKVSGNGRKLFVVGDIKQAIYRFRLADPEIFKEKCSDENMHSILLRENFRSGRNIISSINSVFERIMTDELGDTDYSKNALILGKEKDDDKSESAKVVLVNSTKNEDKLTTEARAVADMIVRLNTEEGIAFGDIAILLRSFGKTGETFRKALVKRGVPVSSGQGGEFFDSDEISSMISVLRIMDNPHNDIPLIAALRSSYFGFTPDELSDIRICDRDADYFDALRIHAKENKKSANFIETLSKLRLLAPDLSTDSMLRLIINETDAETICSLMPDGERRMSNLMQLVSLGAKFEKDGYHGLHRFILYLDKLKEKNTDITTAESDNAVRIMSIHKSKGLEFPVVFVSDIKHQFNESDSRANVLVHPELGLGPKVTDNIRKVQYPTIARNAIVAKLSRELRSEEMRLLYVALTRAEQRLYLTACVDDADKAIANAQNVSLANANNPLTWILNAGTLEVNVINAQDETDEVLVLGHQNDRKADSWILADFEHEYEFKDSVDIPSKINATELKQLYYQDDEARDLIKRGRSRKVHTDDEKITAAEKGTATHKVLQLMNFNNDVDSEVERLLNGKYISKRQALAADTAAIKEFVSSDIGKIVASSENVRREFEFMLLYDADELLGRGGDEKVLLRGVVDCIIEQEDGLIIIDYKTDRVNTDEDIFNKVNEYSIQLELYSKSLERVFEKPVKEKILYFLSVGRAISL